MSAYEFILVLVGYHVVPVIFSVVVMLSIMVYLSLRGKVRKWLKKTK